MSIGMGKGDQEVRGENGADLDLYKRKLKRYSPPLSTVNYKCLASGRPTFVSRITLLRLHAVGYVTPT